MTISIWYQHENRPAEVIDRVSGASSDPRAVNRAEQLAYEYRMAFACLPGQHRYGKDRVWVGNKHGQTD